MSGRNKSVGFAVLSIVLVLAAGLVLAGCGGGAAPKPAKVYKVTFEASGGEPVPEAQLVEEGSKIELPKAMARTKFTFSGWYKDLDCKEPWDFAKDTVESDIILFANWKSTAGKSGSGGGGSGNSGGTPGGGGSLLTPSYTVTWPTDLRWYINRPLSSVSLTGKVSSAEPGTYDWDDPGLSLDTEGDCYFDATFTPTDTSLSPKTQSIKVKVIDLGNGTSVDPFRVSDSETLRKVGTGHWADPDLTWDLSSYYKLMNDIPMNAAEPLFPVIGDSSNIFTGTFDGDNKTIRNLKIDNGANNYTGLFAFVDSDGTVMNLKLEDISVSGALLTGGIAGYCRGEITGCQVIRGSVTGTGDVGGIVGYIIEESGSSKYPLVENCFSTCTVSATGEDAGGIAGAIFNYAELKKCYATGAVNGTNYVGGIVGCIDQNALVENCYATGAVSGNQRIGGIAGGFKNANGVLFNCYATGAVSGNDRIGGIVGSMAVSSEVLINNVALNNNKLTLTGSGTYIGRVAGNISGSNIYNYAEDDSSFSGVAAITNKDGASVSSSEIITEAWWNPTPFDPPTWNTSPGTAWDFSAVWKMDGTDPPTLQ